MVAWAPFDDRASKIIVLCQCGIGADYEEKTLPPQRWPDLIKFVAPPVRALAVPFEDFGGRSLDEKWRSLAVDAGMLLDRTRIARFAKADDEAGLRAALSGWIVEVVPLLQSPD